MIAHYANPYSRRPFWRARADDGSSTIEVRSLRLPDGAGTALRSRSKVLDRHLLLFSNSEEAAVVYVASDDSEAHWQIFLLVAAVALVVAVKHFVEKGPLREDGA